MKPIQNINVKVSILDLFFQRFEELGLPPFALIQGIEYFDGYSNDVPRVYKGPSKHVTPLTDKVAVVIVDGFSHCFGCNLCENFDA